MKNNIINLTFQKHGQIPLTIDFEDGTAAYIYTYGKKSILIKDHYLDDGHKCPIDPNTTEIDTTKLYNEYLDIIKDYFYPDTRNVIDTIVSSIINKDYSYPTKVLYNTLFGWEFIGVNFKDLDMSIENCKFTSCTFNNCRVKLQESILIGSSFSRDSSFIDMINDVIFNNCDIPDQYSFKDCKVMTDVVFSGKCEVPEGIEDGLIYGSDIYGLTSSCPQEGSFIAYKRCGHHIVVLKIPEDAKRFGRGLRCCADKAYVIRIETLSGKPSKHKSVKSSYNKNFKFTVGKLVTEADYDESCYGNIKTSKYGIQFYLSRQGAVKYRF